jgi:hypothetical protein
MSFRLQLDRWTRLHYGLKPMTADPSKSWQAQNASVPSPSRPTDPAAPEAPQVEFDQAINELIVYLAEEAAISPAEAFSAVAQGRVLEVTPRSDRARPRLAGLNALFRHFVRRP